MNVILPDPSLLSKCTRGGLKHKGKAETNVKGVQLHPLSKAGGRTQGAGDLAGAGNCESFFAFLYFCSIQSWCTPVLLIFFFLQVKFLQEVALGNTSVTPS